MESVLSTLARSLSNDIADSGELRAKQFATKVAKEFVADVGDVQNRLAQLRRQIKRGAIQPVAPFPQEGNVKLNQLSADEIELLEVLVLHPELAPTALADVADDELRSPPAQEIFQTYRRFEESGYSLD